MMDNVLARIIDEKRDEVRHLAAHNSFADLHQAAQTASAARICSGAGNGRAYWLWVDC